MSMYELVEETETKLEETTSGKNNVDAIVLLVDEFSNFGKKSYDVNILGASMYNWVIRACPTKPALVNYHRDADLLQTVKPALKNAEWTLVLFSDTPLITSSGVKQMLDFAISKDLSVCKLQRGYIFKTEYIKNAFNLYAVNTYDVCANELFVVDNTDKLVRAQKILKDRIIKYHINSGVNIVSPEDAYIECSVSIEPGVVIEPFVKLEGTTTIGANSKICSNVVIVDSKIDEHVIIKNSSNIISSAVLDNAIIGNNCTIQNKSVVGEEVIISAGNLLDNCQINKDSKVGEGCALINTKVASNVNILPAVKCLGNNLSDVKIGSGAVIGETSVILGGAYIKQDVTVPPLSQIKGK